MCDCLATRVMRSATIMRGCRRIQRRKKYRRIFGANVRLAISLLVLLYTHLLDAAACMLKDASLLTTAKIQRQRLPLHDNHSVSNFR